MLSRGEERKEEVRRENKMSRNKEGVPVIRNPGSLPKTPDLVSC